jgi:hypothetical protein
MPLKGIVYVYSENHTKPININTELVTVKAADAYSHHSAVKG